MTAIMSSAEIARVKEITPLRVFLAQNTHDETPVEVEYLSSMDALHCLGCGDKDNCTHTARIRLSGILTNTVKENVKVIRPRRGANNG